MINNSGIYVTGFMICETNGSGNMHRLYLKWLVYHSMHGMVVYPWDGLFTIPSMVWQCTFILGISDLDSTWFIILCMIWRWVVSKTDAHLIPYPDVRHSVVHCLCKGLLIIWRMVVHLHENHTCIVIDTVSLSFNAWLQDGNSNSDICGWLIGDAMQNWVALVLKMFDYHSVHDMVVNDSAEP